MTIRLYLTAEGDTEERFAALLLGPHLAAFGVQLVGIRATAVCRKKRQVHRGGMSRYLPVKNDICRWIKQDHHADARFTTMFDLYGLPTDFPGYDEAAAFRDPYQRVARLEEALAADIGDRRFIPYIQLHEFEALLLADVEVFLKPYPRRTKEVEALKTACERFAGPEWIDDGESTAPSKRIRACFPDYGPRAKHTLGPQLAQSISLDMIRGKCPHFDQWLRKLEQLGTSSTSS